MYFVQKLHFYYTKFNMDLILFYGSDFQSTTNLKSTWSSFLLKNKKLKIFFLFGMMLVFEVDPKFCITLTVIELSNIFTTSHETITYRSSYSTHQIILNDVCFNK